MPNNPDDKPNERKEPSNHDSIITPPPPAKQAPDTPQHIVIALPERLEDGGVSVTSDANRPAPAPETPPPDKSGDAPEGDAGRNRSNLPVQVKRPAADGLNVRSTPQNPVPSRPKPAAPSTQKRPGPAGPNNRPAPGKTAPAGQKRPAPPPGADGPRKVASYDISPEGKITKRPDKEPELDTGSAKFKVNFDFDDAYKDVPEEKPLRIRREKRTGCVGGVLYAVFVICVSIILASLIWMATVDVLGFGEDDEQINVFVPVGFTIEDITEMLYDAGLIKYKFLFNIYADYSSAEEKISPGSYVLNMNYDYRAIVQGMTARAGVRVERTVTIPEGYTMAQIFTLLDDYGVCPANELWQAAANYDFNYDFLDKDTLGERLRLEGFLFPETHNFYLDSKPEQVLTILLREFNRRFTEEYITRAENMGLSIHDIINVAAMIEREAGSDEERPRIAAVIYNRLNNPRDFPRLEIDATIHYALAGTDRPFSIELDSPYNTYMHPGLPPGPIANPGMASIRAALYPETTNEYYYALNRQGTHNFFRTYAQHQAFVASAEYGGR